jgi:hypothetical protein
MHRIRQRWLRHYYLRRKFQLRQSSKPQTRSHASSATRRRRHRELQHVNKTTYFEDERRSPTSTEQQAEWSRISSKYLHCSWLMYDMRYGVSLEAFLTKRDVLQDFRNIKILSNPMGLLRTQTLTTLQREAHWAMVAAAKLTHKRDSTVAPLLDDHETIDVNALKKRMSIYTCQGCTLPIVIDTGASCSLTPNADDFIGSIKPSSVKSLTGLADDTEVVGEGLVEWTIRDVFGVTRTMRTQAYYVPKAHIRLLSPQSYFQESTSGSCLITAKSVSMMTRGTYERG